MTTLSRRLGKSVFSIDPTTIRDIPLLCGDVIKLITPVSDGITQVPARPMQVATLHVVPIDRIADATVDRCFCAVDDDGITSQDDGFGNVLVLFVDDAKAIVFSLCDLNSVNRQGRAGNIEVNGDTRVL